MKYLIFGNNGQLGKEFTDVLTRKGIECVGYDLPGYDISNYTLVSKLINVQYPDVIINCAGYNSVDMAEFYFEDAYRVNSYGPENIAIVCKRENIKFVHFSSDYVFDGNKSKAGLYTEADTPNPVNAYGRTKLEAERLVANTNPDALIVRTSWLYGDGENNFIFKCLKWATQQNHLKITSDEISIPTSTRLVVEIACKAINNNLTGLYHITCTGWASRYEWAKLILQISNSNAIIYPVNSKQFHLITKRPLFSAMDNSKIATALQIELPNWKDEFINYMQRLKHNAIHRNPNLKYIKNDMGIV